MAGGFFGLLELFGQFIQTVKFGTQRAKLILSQEILHTISLSTDILEDANMILSIQIVDNIITSFDILADANIILSTSFVYDINMTREIL